MACFQFPIINLKRLVIANIVLFLCLCFVLYTQPNMSTSPARLIKSSIRDFFPGSFTNQSASNSSHRWLKIFHDIFDVPHPLTFRIGPDNVKSKNKYFFYRCDTGTMSDCGGWGNRAQGIMTAYLLANLTGRIFKSEIIMHECEFQRFIVPNRVNWSLETSFHETVLANEKVKIMDMYRYKPFYDTFKKTDWVHHAIMNAEFIYMKCYFDMMDNFRDTKFYAKQLQWMQGQDRVALNRFLFTHLFKPSSYMQEKVVNFLTEHVGAEEKLLCIHLRMGKNPTIPNDIRRGLDFGNLANVWKTVNEILLPRLGDNTKIFLMSDSTDAIARAHEQKFADRMFLSPGEIIHIELTENATYKQTCDGLEKVMFEQLILLHCDTLILTESTLSRMSAYLRGRDDELYCFLTEGPVIPCKLINLKMLYHDPR